MPGTDVLRHQPASIEPAHRCRRNRVDPLMRILRLALRLEREELATLIERLTEALAPVAA
jgi:hypothetical protein